MHHAFFEGLVQDEHGQSVNVVIIGGEAHYVVEDDGFHRHILARDVDKQVFEQLRGQIEDHRDIAVSSALQMLGRDDLFTKAAIDASIKNMDQALEGTLPPEAKSWLGMLGFRVIVNVHGEVVRVDTPNNVEEDE